MSGPQRFREDRFTMLQCYHINSEITKISDRVCDMVAGIRHMVAEVCNVVAGVC